FNETSLDPTSTKTIDSISSAGTAARRRSARTGNAAETRRTSTAVIIRFMRITSAGAGARRRAPAPAVDRSRQLEVAVKLIELSMAAAAALSATTMSHE